MFGCVCLASYIVCFLCVCVLAELLNRGGCEVCVCAEIEELRSQVSRLQSRNRELELQSSGRNSDHARQIRQVTRMRRVNAVPRKMQAQHTCRHAADTVSTG